MVWGLIYIHTLCMAVARNYAISTKISLTGASMRHFEWEPTTYVLLRNEKTSNEDKYPSYLIPCMLGNFSCFCCCLLSFFQNELFQKFLSWKLSECQTVWIQIRSDQDWSGSTIFPKVISRCQKSPLARKSKP